MKVQSTIKPKKIEIDEYSVYLNSDIKKIKVPDESGKHTEYEYNQTQYSKDEFISLMSEQNKDLEDKLTDTQMALCEIFESFVTAEDGR